MLRRACLQIPYCTYVERRYRSLHALDHQFAERLGVGYGLDRHMYFGVHQDLTAARFGAQPCGEIHDRADRRVIVPPLETDTAKRCIAVGDSHSEAELVAKFA